MNQNEDEARRHGAGDAREEAGPGGERTGAPAREADGAVTADAPAEPVEPVNIGRVQRRVRTVMGTVTLVVTVLVAVYLIGFSGLSAVWRLLLFIPFYAGAHSIIEARTGVCSYMAQRGERNLDAVFSRSGEPIDDESLVEQIMERSAKATLGAALVAGLLTSVCLLVPAP